MTETDAQKLVSDLIEKLDYDIWKEVFVVRGPSSRTKIKELNAIVLRHFGAGSSKVHVSPADAVKAKGGRTFAPITKEALKAKIEAACREGGEYFDFHNLISGKGGLKKDLKVKFDTENFTDGQHASETKNSKVLGYHTLGNGLTFCGMCAGGDWECAVHWIVYWDGKKLRGYVPTEGNPWNTDTKEAYGNNDAADAKNARKRWPAIYKDAEVEADDFATDEAKMIEDIKARLVLVQIISPLPRDT